MANRTFGDDFEDLGDYLRRGRGRVDPSQRVGWVEFRNLPTRRMDIAERIMEGTASLSYTRKPVFHLSISFAPGDAVDAALMKRVMAQTLSDLPGWAPPAGGGAPSREHRRGPGRAADPRAGAEGRA